MFNNKYALKYETLYIGSFEITQSWANDTVTLKMGVIKIGRNIRRIQTYKYDTNLDD